MPRALLWLMFLSFALAQPVLELKGQEGASSCSSWRVLDAKTRQPIPLPAEVLEQLRCTDATLSPDGRWLTFDRSDELLAWDFPTRRVRLLARIALPVGGVLLTWAPDSRRFALTLVEQPSPVPKHLLVRVFRVGSSGVIGEERFYLPVLFDCGSVCLPRRMYWTSALELTFQTSLPSPGNESHDTPEFDSLLLPNTGPP